VGTVVGGFAPNFGVLLIGRVIQSAGAGVMLPLMQTVFLMIFPVNKRGAAMGYIGLVISFAPAIGPALSGWITASYSWRLLFWA
ncbi:MFS transporter, partial [Micrococcus sp. SIMBA_144]